MNRVLVGFLVVTSACRSLELPEPPPPPGPGLIQGTVVYAKPGQSTPVPAKGATIELLGSSLSTSVTADTGYFSLSPVPVREGALLFRLDSDGDGKVDHQKLLRLEDLKAGPGVDVALGEVLLGGNAIVRGSVLRANVPTANGHAGSTVFVPEGPFIAYAGDNGAFTFENLPEGTLTLSFFRPGYISQRSTITLRAGEVFTHSAVALSPDPAVVTLTTVTGTVLLFGAPSSDGVTVRASSTSATATTDEQGRYTFTGLDPGLTAFSFEKAGFVSATVRNVLVTGANVDVATVLLVPGTSSRPDLDAGAPFDAGFAADAGAPDAGGIDAGASADAGLTDDAGTTTDAGLFDAGTTTDAGLTDAGTSTDAGSSDAGPVDAGSAPVAAVTAPAFVLINASFTLNATTSVGDRPLVYNWTQLSGPTVTIPNNNTVVAATPTITAPNAPTVLRFGLTVTDTNGRTSPQVQVAVPVGARPTAVIAAGTPATVYASQQVLIDGSTSTDTTGSGVVQYDWAVLPTSVTAVPQGASGNKVLLTMPSTVATPTAVSVSLVVTNGLGIQSINTSTVSFTLTTAAAPVWSVDAGQPFIVNALALATLTGSATAPGVPGATFTYQWSPAFEPDSGVADWQLTDPTAQTTTFVAPAVVGASRFITFTLTATSTSGLTPAQKQATTWATVVDRTKPTVVGTSLRGTPAMGSNMGLIIDFSEPINPASVNGVTVNIPSGAPYSAPPVARRIVTGSRLVILFDPPAPVGNSYILSVANVDDLSPAANRITTVTFPFVTETRWTPVFESQSMSNSEPRPGLVVQTPDGGLSEPRVTLFGRKNDTTWFLSPVNPATCPTGPCSIADDVTAPVVPLLPTPVRGVRGLVVKNVGFALAQVKDLLGDAGIAFSNAGGTWAPIASPPGTMYSDETTLFSTYAENNTLKVAQSANAGLSWSQPDSGIITVDPTNFNTDAGADIVLMGTQYPTYDAFVIGKTTSGDARAYSKDPLATTWTSYGALSPSADKVAEARISHLGGTGYSGAAMASLRRVSGELRLVLFGSVNNSCTLWSPGSGLTTYDAKWRDTSLYVAAAVNGQLLIKYCQTGVFAQQSITGPGAGGSFNNNVTCTAESPELFIFDEKMYVAWAEKCGSSPWKMYFRGLE